MSDSEIEFDEKENEKDEHQINYEGLLDKIIVNKKRDKLIFPKANITYGTTKTYINNFISIMNILKRDSLLFVSFMKEEMNTEVTVVDDKLIIHNKFPEKKVNSIYSKFIKKFIICNSCGGSNTIISKNHRLLINECVDCRSSFTINN